MSPEHVLAFRSDYRERRIPGYYRGWAHLLTTSALCLLLMGLALSRIERLGWLDLLAVPIGGLLANLVEYGVHRGFQHQLRRPFGLLYKRHALEHHRFFTHEMMAIDGPRDFSATMLPIWIAAVFTVLVAGALALVPAWLFGRDLGLLVYAALVFYYLFYEWAHLSSHMPEDSRLGRIPGVAFARRYHGLHHDPRKMDRNFNFAVPISDWLFGTRDRG